MPVAPHTPSRRRAQPLGGQGQGDARSGVDALDDLPHGAVHGWSDGHVRARDLLDVHTHGVADATGESALVIQAGQDFNAMTRDTASTAPLLITGSETPRETMVFFALLIGCYALSALCFAAAKRVLLALLSGALAAVSFPLALFIGYVVEMLQSQQ